MVHEACRKVVCEVCYNERGKKASRKIAEAEARAIKELIIANFSLLDPRFPAGLCLECHIDLNKWIHGDCTKPLALTENYDPEIQMSSRSKPDCICRICVRATLNGVKFKQFVSSIGKSSKGRPGFSKGDKLCSKCFSMIYRGSSHSVDSCRSSTLTLENVKEALSDKIINQIIHGTIANAKQSGDTFLQLTSPKGGKPMIVPLGNQNMNPVVDGYLTADEISKIQVEARLSDRQTLSILKNLRLKWGWKCIVPHIQEAMRDRKGLFGRFFVQEITTFLDSNGREIRRPFVYCSDIFEFVQTLAEIRYTLTNYFTIY